MPIKLLPQLRFLNASLPVTRLSPMKTLPSITAPILSRIFPFRLKYLKFNPNVNSQLGARRLSTRSSRSRPPGSGSEFRKEMRAAKSLIEDEAELSEWVSELRTGSFRGGVASEDETDSHSDRNRGKNRDRRRVREREGFSMKRRRETGLGETFSRDGDHSGRIRERERERDGFSIKRRRDSDEGGFGSRVNKRFDTDEERFNIRRGKVGNVDRNGKRGGDYGVRRDGKGFREKKMVFDDGDEADNDSIGESGEERKEFMQGLRDLVDEEESDADEDDHDDGILMRNASSSLGLENDRPSSPGKFDSYLSESR